MAKFTITAELTLNIEPSPDDTLDTMRLKALHDWNDLIWRHYTVHTSTDLNERLKTTIFTMEDA
jgi:hypothetical protein